MRIVFKKRSAGQIEFGIIYGSMALIALGAAKVIPILSIVPPCVFKRITGVPCPTCGATRSVLLLSQGDIGNAFSMNPLTALGLVAAVPFFLYSIVTLVFNLPRMGFILTDREKTVVHGTVFMLLVVQWAYLIFTL
jgi:hypothetical protein